MPTIQVATLAHNVQLIQKKFRKQTLTFLLRDQVSLDVGVKKFWRQPLRPVKEGRNSIKREHAWVIWCARRLPESLGYKSQDLEFV